MTTVDVADVFVWDGAKWVASLVDSFAVEQTENVSVAPDATVNTKGAWVELLASTAEDSTLLWVTVSGLAANTVNSSCLVDIAVGASGSEVPLVSNVAVGGATGQIYIPVPLAVPAGSRIAARSQVATAGRVPQLAVTVMNDVLRPASSVDVLATSTANSEGTPWGNNNVWGEIVASTPTDYYAMFAIASCSITNAAAAIFNSEVAYGASGSEVLVRLLYTASGTAETMESPRLSSQWNGLLPGAPTGTRIAARTTSSASGAIHRLTILGFRA